jgi:hypothetical protein
MYLGSSGGLHDDTTYYTSTVTVEIHTPTTKAPPPRRHHQSEKVDELRSHPRPLLVSPNLSCRLEVWRETSFFDRANVPLPGAVRPHDDITCSARLAGVRLIKAGFGSAVMRAAFPPSQYALTAVDGSFGILPLIGSTCTHLRFALPCFWSHVCLLAQPVDHGQKIPLNPRLFYSIIPA